MRSRGNKYICKRLTDSSKLGLFLGNTGLCKERDEGLVGRLNKHKLEGVSVERDALKRAQDGVEHSATGN